MEAPLGYQCSFFVFGGMILMAIVLSITVDFDIDRSELKYSIRR
jgi:hypothetical protein